MTEKAFGFEWGQSRKGRQSDPRLAIRHCNQPCCSSHQSGRPHGVRGVSDGKRRSTEFLTKPRGRITQTPSILEQAQAHAICSRGPAVGMSLGPGTLDLGTLSDHISRTARFELDSVKSIR